MRTMACAGPGAMVGIPANVATRIDPIAAEIQVISPDFGHLEPIVNAARRELAAAGVTEAPKVVLADSGYWHTEQMDRLAADGIAVLIPPNPGCARPCGRAAGTAAATPSCATSFRPNTAAPSTSSDNI
jgi:hypothetical protein